MKLAGNQRVWQLPPVRRPLAARLEMPGDKSISHRVLMMAAMADGQSVLEHVLQAHDTQATCNALMALGVSLKREDPDRIIVEGRGLAGLVPPAGPIDCGNSGTTLRLMAGVLAACGRGGVLTGDGSLRRRPMARIVAPLQAMGAIIRAEAGDVAPLHLAPSPGLVGTEHHLEVASGQIKGALLLAALGASGTVALRGALSGRDHTERLLPAFGGRIDVCDDQITLVGPQRLVGTQARVPGDLSALAFWLAAVALRPRSYGSCHHVGANPTRDGFVRLLAEMGGDIRCRLAPSLGLEPIMAIDFAHRPLRGVEVAPHQVPALIDELPLVALVATQAHGTTRVRGAEELRHKESDRLAALAEGLRRLGAHVTLYPDGFEITGPQPLTGGQVDSHGDHRIAMMLAVASIATAAPVTLSEPDCIDVSYPGFRPLWQRLTQNGLAPD